MYTTNMNISTLAKLLNVHADTVRRWTQEYRQFMSPTATPGKGKTRQLVSNDLAVLAYIAHAREQDMLPDEIRDRLAEMQQDGWRNLPRVPEEWTLDPGDDTMPVALAAERASAIAQVAVLQTELQHVRAGLEEAQQALEEAQEKVESLQAEIETLRGSQHATEHHLHQAQLELERAKADVARYEGQLMQYAVGSGRPVPVVVLVALTAVAVAVLMIVLLVVVRLVL
jgi:DNA-binding transcriptional MerR regulator